MNTNRIPCKKCLISELDQSKIYTELMDYINSIDESLKATPETYQSRLTICQSCPNLTDGICSQCGCFVQSRAIKRTQGCPGKRW
jgi:hypothetical protein